MFKIYPQLRKMQISRELSGLHTCNRCALPWYLLIISLLKWFMIYKYHGRFIFVNFARKGKEKLSNQVLPIQVAYSTFSFCFY